MNIYGKEIRINGNTIFLYGGDTPEVEIVTGEHYWYHSQVWEGKWCDHKMCATCNDLEGRVIDASPFPYHDEGYYEWGGLHEAAAELELI